MDFDTLATAVLSSVVVTSAGGWALKAAIEKGIQLGVDQKLEKLRSDLRTKEEEIKALRAGALAALSAKHEELDRRRIKAAEALWMATIKQSKYRTAISYVSILKISEIKKTVAAGGVGADKVKQFAEVLWLSAGIETQAQPNESLPEVERLFVSEIAWAAFDALQAIGGRAGALLLALKTGVDLAVLKDESETNTALKSVLPRMATYIDNYPEVAAYYLVDQLKDKILMELRYSFAGSEFDSAPLRQARQIMDFAHNMSSELKEQIPAEFKNNTPLPAIMP